MLLYLFFLPDVSAVFVSSPSLCSQLLRSEWRDPRQMVPRPWEVYNEKYGVRRGIFFAVGEEWTR